MKSVVVCGSKRYTKEIAAFCKKLEKLNVLVFEPNFRPKVDEKLDFDGSARSEALFKGLTLEHFDWIRKAEACFIFNKDDYVGASVTMEIGYATALGKPVFALSANTGDPCRDALIDKVVKTPAQLIKLL